MKSRALRIILYVVSALVIAGALMYANYRLASGSPGGVDFLTHWVGTRALFQGESPYRQDVAVRVQQLVYGRPAQAGENEFLDPYLIYTEAIFAPFALIGDYSIARGAWMTFLEFCTVAILLISMAIVNWRPKFLVLAAYFLYGMFGYFSVRPIVNGSLATVIGLLLTASIWAIKNRKDRVAGVLMVLALGKPNLTILPLLLLMLWMISRRRWSFVAWFVGAFAVLVLAGMLIVPDWPLQNLMNILHYSSYNPPTTVGAVLEFWLPGFGRWIGLGIYAVIALVLLRAWIKVYGADFHSFVWAFSLTLAAGQWFLISTGPDNFIILVLPLALILKSMNEGPNGAVWVCTSLLTLLIGLWILFAATADRSQGTIQSPVMFFPLPAFLILGLYLILANPPGERNLQAAS